MVLFLLHMSSSLDVSYNTVLPLQSFCFITEQYTLTE